MKDDSPHANNITWSKFEGVTRIALMSSPRLAEYQMLFRGRENETCGVFNPGTSRLARERSANQTT